jgi:DNA-binding transcriptional LysR family regulator
MRFDLVDLRLFVNVVDARSITRGAARSHLALASASTRVRGLEERLGVVLLERGRRGVTPTSAGHRLVEHARVVLQQAERLQDALGALARDATAAVRVLSNTAALTEHLPSALAVFLARNPETRIDLDEDESGDIVAAVAAGRADIGIASVAALSSALASAITTHPFRTDRLVLAVPRGDALAGRRAVWFRDALDRDFVGLPSESALARHVDAQAARSTAALRYRIRVRGFEALCRMVEAGVGVGVVPETAAKRARRSLAIDVVRLRDDWATRELAICVPRHRTLAPAAVRLVDHLRGRAS